MATVTSTTGPAAKKSVVVGIGEMSASNEPNVDLVTYSVGPSIGVTVYDPVTRTGGLLHAMLPDSGMDSHRAHTFPAIFIDTGIARLLEKVLSLGAQSHQLEFRVAGGAQFMEAGGAFNVGERNREALAQQLNKHGFSIRAHDLGGIRTRSVRLDLTTGQLAIRSPGGNPYFL